MAGEQQIDHHQTEEHSQHPGCFYNPQHTVEAEPVDQDVGRKGKCITIEQAVDRAISKEDFAKEIDAILDDLDNGYLPVTDDEDNSLTDQKPITLLPLEDDSLLCSNVMTIQELAPFKSIVEKRIINASAEIRKDPGWVKHLSSKEKRQSWLETSAEKFNTTAGDMDYIFNELEYYKILQENTPQNMVLGGTDMVWIKDIPDDDSLTLDLKQYAVVLEAAHPKRLVDHQGGGCVMRLIDPFLYPLDYKLTHVLSSPIESSERALNVETFGNRPGSFKAWADIVAGLNNGITAGKEQDIYKNYTYAFCWLPTDIRVDMDGSVIIKSYINNLHPTKHAAFYKTLSKALEAVIPLAEQVLADLLHPTSLRVIVDDDRCVKFTAPHPYNDTWGVSDLVDDDAWNAWQEGIVYTEPVPKGFTKPDRPLPLPPTYSLRGEELQIVVEMDTTYLTPENPKHGKSEWQNSGILSDQIVATAIWYYDVENAEVSDIQFRDPIGSYEEHDMICDILEKTIFEYAYGVDDDIGKGYGYSQPVGTTGIKSGRIVCFPNSYQHLEPPMELADPPRCGHVRRLYFHLVHPGVRIPSTSIVAPQQQEWWAETAFSVPPLDSLPAELQVMVQQRVDMPMSLEVACKKYASGNDRKYHVDGEFEIYDTYIHYGDIF
ncbi:hypothetical protein IWW48_004386 [Coemansia sp. RSA 1200]|nr:hypothetical protein IWW48_004386 [Coemansia sp. RSA 1200]